MQYSFTIRAIGSVLTGIIKAGVPDKAVQRKIKQTYKEIIQRASDIGADNKLIMSYLLAAYFIAMNREDGLSPEENLELLDKGMRKSKLVKTLMGSSKGYFSEKNMESRRAWSKKTHEKRYKNDWVVDVLEKTDDYEFGLDYTECGVCKLCRDEGCPQWAQYLCRLDFMLVEIMDIHLERTTTLADGGDKCDFRFSKN